MSTLEGARAAQYIRMSTDKQNLSPEMQRHAIEEFAKDAGIEVVATYQDSGKSGLTIEQRPEMRKLMADVADPTRRFSVVLVYDVARWGRFEDTDASAYYEYHCRLHGVEVIYVKEPFAVDRTPMAAMIKAWKRVEAAEFSRVLALKVRDAQARAVALGFQFGRLPCIGVDRVAVSFDRTRQRVLMPGERKPFADDHIVWIPGPAGELRVVRRIFREYTTTDQTMAGIASKLNSEGVKARGRPFTFTMIRSLLDSEIFCGDFVWGQRKSGCKSRRRPRDAKEIVTARGVFPKVVSRAMWNRAQAKRRHRLHIFNRSRDDLLKDLRRALAENPALAAPEIRSHNCATIGQYVRAFGSVGAAMRLAGRDQSTHHRAYLERKSRTHRLSNQFRRDLIALLTFEAAPIIHRGKEQVFTLLSGIRVRFKLIWRRRHRDGSKWHVPKTPMADCDYVLLVRMLEDETAADFILIERTEFRRLRSWFSEPKDVRFKRLLDRTALVEALRRL